MGDHEESLKLSKCALDMSKKGKEDLKTLDAQVMVISACLSLGKFEDALNTIIEAESLINTLSSDQSRVAQMRAMLIHQKGRYYIQKGDYSRSLKYYQQSLSIREELGNKDEIADSLHNIGTCYWYKGELTQGLEYLQQGLALRKELDNKLDIAGSLNNIGIIYHQKGELNQALEYYQQSLALKKLFSNKSGIANTLNNIGIIYHQKGELSQALEYYQQSLKLRKELDNEQDIAESLNNIGLIYKDKGELDEALDHLQDCLVIFQKLDDKQNIAETLNNIGVLYSQKNMLEQALDYLQKSLHQKMAIGGNVSLAYTLSGLITISTEMSSLDRARHYLQQLQDINKGEKNKEIDLHYRISKATILLKTDPGTYERLSFSSLHAMIKNVVTAQEMFQQITEEEMIECTLTVEAIFNLCEILIVELKTFENEESLEEIKRLTSRLLSIGKDQCSFSLL
ncbi:MAG: tetratricopeptide repeat protein, partial [Candidatus Odinarchaeota archaeon]